MPKDKEQWAESGDWTMDTINMNKHTHRPSCDREIISKP